MSKKNNVDSFNREIGTEEFVVPFTSRMVETKRGTFTVLNVPAWSIDPNEVENIALQLNNVFGEMTERDVDEIIDRCIDICRFRYVSENMKRYEPSKYNT